MAGAPRFERRSFASKARHLECRVLPLHHAPIIIDGNDPLTTLLCRHKMVGRGGIEPPESLTADLQSAPLPYTVYRPIKHDDSINLEFIALSNFAVIVVKGLPQRI